MIDQNLGFRFYHEIEGTGGERWHESETNLEVFIADYKFNHPFHCIDSMDISDLVNLEQQFYNVGYKEGVQHGRVHGLIEGRALGLEKGFEMWEEVGFYLGFATVWKAFVQSQKEPNSRALLHLTHLSEAITLFPMSNAPSSIGDDVDISQLLNRIRSRYKATCATLGIRPRLSPASSSIGEEPTVDPVNDINTNTVESDRSAVWSFTAAARQAGPGGLSF